MLHILLQHLVCREVRLTATTSRSKSLDEAVRLLDLALGILNTSVREHMSDGAASPWIVISYYYDFLLKKKRCFYPNIYIYKNIYKYIYIYKKINRNLSISFNNTAQSK